jgi:hypothetical protein
MKNLRKIYIATAALVFTIATTQNAIAQNRNKNTKTVTAKRDYKHVPSKNVNYANSRKKVVAVRSIPNRTVIKHNGSNYYYSGNRYYSYSSGRYIPIAPKIGFRITTLPAGYQRLQYRNTNYFWYNGIFYTGSTNSYQVVQPEIGTVINELPADAERVEIDGYTYYELNNVLYEKTQVNGQRAYEVIGFVEQ